MNWSMFCILIANLWLVHAMNSRNWSFLLAVLWTFMAILPEVWP